MLPKLTEIGLSHKNSTNFLSSKNHFSHLFQMNHITLLFISCLLFTSCGSPQTNTETTVQSTPESKQATVTYQNKGHEVIAKMVEKVGTYQILKDKKGVIYTYTYTTPDVKIDQSPEKYLFDG
jgi:hypothetical protein